MNSLFSVPLLALLMANRLGDSSGDSGRVALLAMMIRPPMMGLLIAMMVAKQKAKTNVVASNSSLGGASSQGSTIVNQVIPRPDHSFFPSFIDLTRKEAAHQAKKLGLTVNFVDSTGTSGKEVVVSQEPDAGAPWPRTTTDVTLTLG